MKIIINENQLKNIINEGSIRLTYKERQQVEEMLPKIIEVIGGEDLGAGNYKEIGVIDGVLANGDFLKTTIYVGVDTRKNLKNAGGYFQRMIPHDLTDNYIVVQQRSFSKYFKGISKFQYDIEKELLGNENMGIEELRSLLVHELIHSKDPKLNQYTTKKDKYGYDIKTYYNSRAEFVTMTGQFFESILTGVDSSYKLNKTKEQIMDALNNILMVYSGKKRIFNQNAKDFIQGSKNRTEFQDIINKPVNFFNIPIYLKFLDTKNNLIHGTAIDTYNYFLKMVKKYNPKEYNRFLRELYRTINEAKDKTKELYKLGNEKITIKGDSMEDLEMKLENNYKNQYMNPKSIEFNPDNYTISFKPGSTKAKSIYLMFEYTDKPDPNPYKLMPIGERAKIVGTYNYFVMLNNDLTNPKLKWVIFIKV
jgi:hypothetical protein